MRPCNPVTSAVLVLLAACACSFPCSAHASRRLLAATGPYRPATGVRKVQRQQRQVGPGVRYTTWTEATCISDGGVPVTFPASARCRYDSSSCPGGSCIYNHNGVNESDRRICEEGGRAGIVGHYEVSSAQVYCNFYSGNCPYSDFTHFDGQRQRCECPKGMPYNKVLDTCAPPPPPGSERGYSNCREDNNNYIPATVPNGFALGNPVELNYRCINDGNMDWVQVCQGRGTQGCIKVQDGLKTQGFGYGERRLICEVNSGNVLRLYHCDA